MVCPECSKNQGFVDIEFHGIKAKACTCGAIMIMEITEEYDDYLQEEQMQKSKRGSDSVSECPKCYFCF
ncbi:hypothetical protein D7X88_15185 [bacterium C-53]|nr:hypothetical protein [Lachnospiraceae bacterium]NBI02197.1 hypothetical protein [Lachnospiraceae bacterium]RKJ08405.1 hypothetical protein D7X88_15185 [bacterium C-53]